MVLHDTLLKLYRYRGVDGRLCDAFFEVVAMAGLLGVDQLELVADALEDEDEHRSIDELDAKLYCRLATAIRGYIEDVKEELADVPT